MYLSQRQFVQYVLHFTKSGLWFLKKYWFWDCKEIVKNDNPEKVMKEHFNSKNAQQF